MIMKKILTLLYLAPIVFTGGCAFGQATVWTHPWTATIKVVDENGQPVAGTTVAVWFYVQPPTGQPEASDKVEGLTDTNGIFKISHASTGSISLTFQANKTGYYSTTKGHEFATFNDNDPQKWDPNETLLLKKIGKPIAMYAKSITSIEFPVFNKPIGYDLTTGDWVAPYGKGVTTDFLFTENHADAKSGYTFTVSFPHSGDGVQGFSRDWSSGISGLLSSHEAPIEGYQPKYEQTQMPDPNRIYYFRVRTVLDENGNIKSTLYGKIYGDFMQFRYYLNPTPNSRILEFDPKQNLLGSLQSFEQVSAP
jgi:hypothetical protein